MYEGLEFVSSIVGNDDTLGFSLLQPISDQETTSVLERWNGEREREREREREGSRQNNTP